eukprot:g37440.t1
MSQTINNLITSRELPPTASNLIVPEPHIALMTVSGAASYSHEELEQFTNTFHPNLKFTWTISDISLPILGLSVSISGVHTCTSSNLVYCIRCSQRGLLYIVANHFNSPSHSLCDVSILGLLQCHNDATCKLEEQQLIFHLRSLQPDDLNIEFT